METDRSHTNSQIGLRDYLIRVVFFVPLWCVLGLSEQYKIFGVWSPSIAYYGVGILTCVWAYSIRSRLISAEVPLWRLLPFLIVALPVVFVLVKKNLAGSSFALLLLVLIVQIPAIHRGKREEVG
jgi:hypothetical protein